MHAVLRRRPRPGDVLIDIGRRNVEGGGRPTTCDTPPIAAWSACAATSRTAGATTSTASTARRSSPRTILNDFSRYAPGQGVERSRRQPTRLDDVRPDRVPRQRGRGPEQQRSALRAVQHLPAGGVTPEPLAYLQIPGFSEGSTSNRCSAARSRRSRSATASSCRRRTMARHRVRRRVSLANTRSCAPIRAFQTGDLAGQGAPTLDTTARTTSASCSLRCACRSSRTSRSREHAVARGGYRYSDYNLGFDTDTYKFGLDWAPDRGHPFPWQLPARGARAEHPGAVPAAARAARRQRRSVRETCRRTAPSGVARGKCASRASQAAQYGNILANPAAQYNGLVGGNPGSRSGGIGHVLVRLRADSALPAGLSLMRRLLRHQGRGAHRQGRRRSHPQQLPRDGDPSSAARSIATPPARCGWAQGFIDDPIVNTGSLQIKGVDLEANYGFDIGRMGSLAFKLSARTSMTY